jgi:general secretion pathway protein B
MSYILDALRKSDQQRHRGVPPTLLAPQAADVGPARRVTAFHGLLAVILIGAGVVIGALRPWQAEQPALAPGSSNNVVEPGPRASPAPASVAKKSAQNQDVRARKTAAATRSATPPKAAKPKVKAKAPRTPRKAAAKAPKEAATPVTRTPDGAGDTAQAQNVMTIADLPLSVRQDIPKMSISVHAYGREPAKRLVGINDRMLREGDTVAPGLVLEQITLDGMIMRFKGYRFRRGVR